MNQITMKQEFNELAQLLLYVMDFYDVSVPHDDMDMEAYDEHRNVINTGLDLDHVPPYPELMTLPTLARKRDYVPDNDTDFREFIANMKWELKQADTVLAFEFNKFGTDKMRERLPQGYDESALQVTALKNGYLNIMTLL